MAKKTASAYASWKQKFSFLTGAATVMNLAGNFYARPQKKMHPSFADGMALAKDWERVGNDLWTSMGRVKKTK